MAAAALARGYSTTYTLTGAEPVLSRVYKKDGGLPRPNATNGYRATLDLTTALYQSSNTYFLALEDALGSVEEPVRMAEAMGLYKFGQPKAWRTDHRREPGFVHLRSRRDQPAGAGQRLLHARRQRHAVRRRPGDGGPRPVPGSRLTGDDGEPLVAGRVHPRGHSRRGSPTR